MNTSVSQPDLNKLPPPSTRFPFFIANAWGCLIVFIGFVFLNWSNPLGNAFNPSNQFLNGPALFQEMANTYGILASIGLWIAPIFALIALLLACAGWLWYFRLLQLTSIVATIGLVLLTSPALTDNQWDYYKTDGYWLVVLGLVLIMLSGFWARWSSSLHTGENKSLSAILTWCALVGGILIFISFFLPWLLLRTPFSATYQGITITGLNLASGSFPFLPPLYPIIAPYGYWALLLIPLAGLLGTGIAWMKLRGQYISHWYWLIIALIPIPFFVFLLQAALRGTYSSSQEAQNITTYGWDITLIGMILLFFSGLLWPKDAMLQKPDPQEQQRIQARRRILGGVAGLIAVAYGGYLFWQGTKMRNTVLNIPLPGSEHYEYGTVSWATDGIHLIMTNTNAFWVWDTVAKKQILNIPYPSSVDRNNEAPAIAWSPDQRLVATAVGGSAQVYAIDAGKWISHWNTSEIAKSLLRVAWSPDNQHVATIFLDTQVQSSGVEIHDAITGNLTRTFPLPTEITSGTRQLIQCTTVAWSPNNQWLAVGGQIRSQTSATFKVFVIVWEIASGMAILNTSYIPGTTAVENYQLSITAAWSPDGKHLAVASDTTGVKLWDISSKKLVRTYVGSGGTFAGLAWSPDSTYMAISEENIVRIWNITNGQTIFSYQKDQMWINGLTWSSQGNFIASSTPGNVSIWQPEMNNL